MIAYRPAVGGKTRGSRTNERIEHRRDGDVCLYFAYDDSPFPSVVEGVRGNAQGTSPDGVPFMIWTSEARVGTPRRLLEPRAAESETHRTRDFSFGGLRSFLGVAATEAVEISRYCRGDGIRTAALVMWECNALVAAATYRYARGALVGAVASHGEGL
ncbi:unnamed protein product, partial [Iphiclides podalirius]